MPTHMERWKRRGSEDPVARPLRRSEDSPVTGRRAEHRASIPLLRPGRKMPTPLVTWILVLSSFLGLGSLIACDSAECDKATQHILACIEADCASHQQRAVCQHIQLLVESYADVDGRCRGDLAEWAEHMASSDCKTVIVELGLNRDCIWGDAPRCNSSRQNADPGTSPQGLTEP